MVEAGSWAVQFISIPIPVSSNAVRGRLLLQLSEIPRAPATAFVFGRLDCQKTWFKNRRNWARASTNEKSDKIKTIVSVWYFR
jgi:hypothetical protein